MGTRHFFKIFSPKCNYSKKRKYFFKIAQSSNTRGVCFSVTFLVLPFAYYVFPSTAPMFCHQSLRPSGIKIKTNKQLKHIFLTQAPVTLTSINIFFLKIT